MKSYMTYCAPLSVEGAATRVEPRLARSSLEVCSIECSNSKHVKGLSGRGGSCGGAQHLVLHVEVATVAEHAVRLVTMCAVERRGSPTKPVTQQWGSH